MLRDSGDYTYNLDAARALANRGPVNHINSSISNYQDLPNMTSNEVLASYRGGQAYPYNGKPYYPVAGWTGPYPDDNVDFSLNCQSYPMLNNEPVHMVPYQTWGTRSKSTASSSMYVDPESPYPYNSTANLVHRPATSSDSTNFSFSSVAASLPSAGTERLLPNPASTRTMTSSSNSTTYRGESHPSYSSSVKTSATTGITQTSPTSPVPEAPTTGYSNHFDGASLGGYQSAGPAIPAHQSRGSHPTSDPYSSTDERIFAPEERLNIGSQGSAVDITGYTYSGGGASVRRVSVSGLSSRATSGDLTTGQGYVPNEGAADSANRTLQHAAAPVSGGTTSVGYTGSGPSSPGNGGGTATDSRRSVVATRR